MTTTKEDIVRNLMVKISQSHPGAKKLIETLLRIIKDTLGSSSGLMISGFGEFRTNHKSARIGRNPKTKVEFTISERTVVTFHASKVFKNELNG